MQAEREVVRFLSSYQAIWHAHFPQLFRRAQWHIVTHLCTHGREGVAVGELYGLVKQVFLLDDSTVKERILEIRDLELCAIDPPAGALAARSVVVPTAALLDQFDRHLLALAKELCATAAVLDPATRVATPRSLDAQQRTIILQSLARYHEPRRLALDRIFDAMNLSRARRVEAIRHLTSMSHWSLLHMAIELQYGVSAFAGSEHGILADQMAASLLTLTGQNFQTTRDHIAYLIALGLLERQPGKSLRVALSESAAERFHQALGITAAALPEVARSLAATLPAGASDMADDASDRCNIEPTSGAGDAAPGCRGATASSGDTAAGIGGAPGGTARGFADHRQGRAERAAARGRRGFASPLPARCRRRCGQRHRPEFDQWHLCRQPAIGGDDATPPRCAAARRCVCDDLRVSERPASRGARQPTAEGRCLWWGHRIAAAAGSVALRNKTENSA